MTIREPYENGRFGLSFELFPPKSPESEAAMWRTVAELMAFEPALVTCTYGAGGSTRGTTLDVLRGLRERHDVPVASHLTCVGSTVDDLRAYLREAAALGVAAIVAAARTERALRLREPIPDPSVLPWVVAGVVAAGIFVAGFAAFEAIELAR